MAIVSKPQYLLSSSLFVPSSSPPLKKRRLESKKNHDTALPTTLKMIVEDVTRKKFLQSLCAQWLFLRTESPKNTVYVITSSLQNEIEKMDAIKNAIINVQRAFPNRILEMVWVTIPKEEFFTSDHFEKMMRAIYSIPFHSIICFQTGNAFISPKRAIMTLVKPLSKKLFLRQLKSALNLTEA